MLKVKNMLVSCYKLTSLVFQNIFYLNFSHTGAVLGYLQKLKRGFGLAFDVYIFCTTFPSKYSLFNTLSMHKVSILCLFHSQDIKQNVL